MDVQDSIGQTPLLRLHRVAGGTEIWIKREAANPGGSIKDRP